MIKIDYGIRERIHIQIVHKGVQKNARGEFFYFPIFLNKKIN